MFTHDIRRIRYIYNIVMQQRNRHRTRIFNGNLAVIFNKLIPREFKCMSTIVKSIQSQKNIRMIILIAFIPISQDQFNSLSRINRNISEIISLIQNILS